MNILFACDSNYVMPLAVCLTSIFENNKGEIRVYVFYNKLSTEEIGVLSELAKKYRQKIDCVRVDDSYFADAPTLRWSRETYYRLLISELLPKDLDRVLYFDCDTIVNKPLDNLYGSDLHGLYLGALEISAGTADLRKRLGLESTGGYYQAGVILFDLDKCRTILNYNIIVKIIDGLGERLQIVDQDIINVIFDGKIMALDPKFNNCEITNFQGSNLNRLFNRVDKKSLDETCIFHYAVGKPWNNLYSGSGEDIWYKYLRLSPYAGLYAEKYDRLKYRIIRTGLVKLIFYGYIWLTPFINKIANKIFPQKLYAQLKQYYRRNIK